MPPDDVALDVGAGMSHGDSFYKRIMAETPTLSDMEEDEANGQGTDDSSEEHELSMHKYLNASSTSLKGYDDEMDLDTNVTNFLVRSNLAPPDDKPMSLSQVATAAYPDEPAPESASQETIDGVDLLRLSDSDVFKPFVASVPNTLPTFISKPVLHTDVSTEYTAIPAPRAGPADSFVVTSGMLESDQTSAQESTDQVQTTSATSIPGLEKLPQPVWDEHKVGDDEAPVQVIQAPASLEEAKPQDAASMDVPQPSVSLDKPEVAEEEQSRMHNKQDEQTIEMEVRKKEGGTVMNLADKPQPSQRQGVPGTAVWGQFYQSVDLHRTPSTSVVQAPVSLDKPTAVKEESPIQAVQAPSKAEPDDTAGGAAASSLGLPRGHPTETDRPPSPLTSARLPPDSLSIPASHEGYTSDLEEAEAPSEPHSQTHEQDKDEETGATMPQNINDSAASPLLHIQHPTITTTAAATTSPPPTTAAAQQPADANTVIQPVVPPATPQSYPPGQARNLTALLTPPVLSTTPLSKQTPDITAFPSLITTAPTPLDSNTAISHTTAPTPLDSNTAISHTGVGATLSEPEVIQPHSTPPRPPPTHLSEGQVRRIQSSDSRAPLDVPGGWSPRRSVSFDVVLPAANDQASFRDALAMDSGDGSGVRLLSFKSISEAEEADLTVAVPTPQDVAATMKQRVMEAKQMHAQQQQLVRSRSRDVLSSSRDVSSPSPSFRRSPSPSFRRSPSPSKRSPFLETSSAPALGNNGPKEPKSKREPPKRGASMPLLQPPDPRVRRSRSYDGRDPKSHSFAVSTTTPKRQPSMRKRSISFDTICANKERAEQVNECIRDMQSGSNLMFIGPHVVKVKREGDEDEQDVKGVINALDGPQADEADHVDSASADILKQRVMKAKHMHSQQVELVRARSRDVMRPDPSPKDTSLLPDRTDTSQPGPTQVTTAATAPLDSVIPTTFFADPKAQKYDLTTSQHDTNRQSFSITPLSHPIPMQHSQTPLVPKPAAAAAPTTPPCPELPRPSMEQSNVHNRQSFSIKSPHRPASAPPRSTTATSTATAGTVGKHVPATGVQTKTSSTQEPGATEVVHYSAGGSLRPTDIQPAEVSQSSTWVQPTVLQAPIHPDPGIPSSTAPNMSKDHRVADSFDVGQPHVKLRKESRPAMLHESMRSVSDDFNYMDHLVDHDGNDSSGDETGEDDDYDGTTEQGGSMSTTSASDAALQAPVNAMVTSFSLSSDKMNPFGEAPDDYDDVPTYARPTRLSSLQSKRSLSSTRSYKPPQYPHPRSSHSTAARPGVQSSRRVRSSTGLGTHGRSAQHESDEVNDQDDQDEVPAYAKPTRLSSIQGSLSWKKSVKPALPPTSTHRSSRRVRSSTGIGSHSWNAQAESTGAPRNWPRSRQGQTSTRSSAHSTSSSRTYLSSVSNDSNRSRSRQWAARHGSDVGERSFNEEQKQRVESARVKHKSLREKVRSLSVRHQQAKQANKERIEHTRAHNPVQSRIQEPKQVTRTSLDLDVASAPAELAATSFDVSSGQTDRHSQPQNEVANHGRSQRLDRSQEEIQWLNHLPPSDHRPVPVSSDRPSTSQDPADTTSQPPVALTNVVQPRGLDDNNMLSFNQTSQNNNSFYAKEVVPIRSPQRRSKVDLSSNSPSTKEASQLVRSFSIGSSNEPSSTMDLLPQTDDTRDGDDSPPAAEEVASSTEEDLTQTQVEETQRELRHTRALLHDTQAKLALSDLQAARATSELEQMVKEGRQWDKVRRQMHNTIQRLRGNIRVYCRVRPAHPDQSQSPDQVDFRFPRMLTDDGKQSIEVCTDQENRAGNVSKFSFDRVFNPTSTQAHIFDEVRELVQSTLDGYRVCIFAYGQTGAGKTYTMTGKDGRDTRGVIPRALIQVFKTTRKMSKAQGWAFKLKCMHVELYNDTLRDLLAPPSDLSGRPASFGARNPYKSGTSALSIRLNEAGQAEVSGAALVEVDSVEEVQELLARSSMQRAVASTEHNEQSSRSHCIFQLQVIGNCNRTGEQINGILNLIDLAGSERASSSTPTGLRLQEACHINRSLFALADVLSAIHNKDPYVPYRNSKLTHLLQPALQGGDCKMLMLCCLSPESKSTHETMCTLRYAEKVNGTVVGANMVKKAKVDLSHVLRQSRRDE